MRPGCFLEEMREARLHSVSKTCGRRRTAVRFGASTSSLPRLLRLPREIGAFYAYRGVLLSHGLHIRGNVLHARNGVA